EVERGRGSGRRLVEDVDDEPALERRELLHLPFERPLECPRRRQQTLEVVARDVLDRDEVARRWFFGWTEVLPHDVNLSQGGSLLQATGRARCDRLRRSRRAAPGCARGVRSAGSCRRNRGGSADR